MNLENFDSNTKRLTNWFNRNFKEAQLGILYSQIKYIPDLAYEDIVNAIIEEAKYFPTIVDIKNKFYQWRRDHPDKAISHQRTHCKDCLGEGLLHIHVSIHGHIYVQVARCIACDNWRQHFAADSPVSFYRRSELEAMGITVEPDLELYKHLPKKKTSINKMAEGVGQVYDFEQKQVAHATKVKEQAKEMLQDEIPF